MGNLDAHQNLADRAEARFGMAEPNRLGVDMASPENRSIFQTTGEQQRPAFEDGHLSFDTTDIYGGAVKNSATTTADATAQSTAPEATPAQTAAPEIAARDIEPRIGGLRDIGPREEAPRDSAANGDGINYSNAPSSGDQNTANASAVSDFTSSPTTEAPASTTEAPASTEVSSEAPAPALTESNNGAPFDNPTNAATIANLTPEQASVYGSVVQLSTPIVTVGADGKLTESTAQGTGFVFTGADGQQYIGTAGHVPAATGTNDQADTTAYAEGPTQVTFADGTTGYSNVLANRNTSISDNSVETGDPGDIAVMSMPYRSPVLQPVPSLNLSPDAPQPGDTLNSVGYGDGKLTTTSDTYLQNTGLDGASMQVSQGDGIHGQSGAPENVSGSTDVSGIWSAGTDNGGTNAYNISVPATNLAALSETTSWLNPNYLSNLANQQPIATPDLRGNSVESLTQPVTGVTLTDGTYLSQPDKYSTTPTHSAPVAPTDAAPAAPTDTTPAPSPTDATPPTADTQPVSTDTTGSLIPSTVTAYDGTMIDGGSEGGGFDFGGGGNMMSMGDDGY